MPNSVFRPKTAVEQVVDVLSGQIRSGKLVGILPSVRALARRYQLSVPSLDKARTILVEQGLLAPRGAKRRLAVLPLPRPSIRRPAAPCWC